MSTAEVSGGSSSPEAAALGQVLTFFGTVADYAAGASPDEGGRVASLAVGMANIGGLPSEDIDALYFAARLRNAGALGNIAFSKGEQLPERARTMQRWDIPADGARICERIGALPAGTADLLRWQAESWDGTGHPDQLRWSGIPKAAQLLHIASAYVNVADPEEALSFISAGSGRMFAPEQVRTFVMWFHMNGGEIEPMQPAFDSLDTKRTPLMHVLDLLSERVDTHNGTPLRAQRVARRVGELARALSLDDNETRTAHVAALLFGIGEIRAPELEAQQFDPLARLGVETRALHALAASHLVGGCDYLQPIAPSLRARAEWYDGTGGPDQLRHDAIPTVSQILGIAVAFDAIDEAYRSRITEERTLPIARLETASGTQFDPQVFLAFAGIVKAHA